MLVVAHTLVLLLCVATPHSHHMQQPCACCAETRETAYRALPASGRVAGRCVSRDTPRLNTAPPCPLRGRGKGKIRFWRRHMPPKTRGWTPRSGDSFPLAPASGPGGGVSPPGCGSDAASAPWACPSALGCGRRLERGSGLAPPPSNVVCGQTSDARDCATPVAYPAVIPRRFPWPPNAKEPARRALKGKWAAKRFAPSAGPCAVAAERPGGQWGQAQAPTGRACV